ncbi:4'-phosphopantetheinyl transferase superfamily protein [Paraclostridium sp. AKS46]|nr:4'-phosphopantetheinyl transferase superfamily protein [Paraclostridium sp. AKS46]
MVKIFALNINQEIKIHTYNFLLSLIDEEKKKCIFRFHHKEDFLRSLYGDLIIRYFMTSTFNVKNEDLVFKKNEFGKPYVEEIPVFFNISHSKDWVVCAFSTHEIGIDVEFNNNINEDVIKYALSKYEYDKYLTLDTSDREKYFYKLWTLKESYIKCIGKGLSVSPDSITFVHNNDNITIKGKISQEYNFKYYGFDNSYSLSICSIEHKFYDLITTLTPEYLYSHFKSLKYDTKFLKV